MAVSGLALGQNSILEQVAVLRGKKSVGEAFDKAMVGKLAVRNHRNFCIVDSQASVKNTDTADSKGLTRARRCRESKRHLAVDTQGLPHAIHITTAATSP